MRVLRHFIRVCSALSVALAAILAQAQFPVRQLTTNALEETWPISFPAASNGRLLWVDGEDSVVYFDGATTNLVQLRDSLGLVDNVVFTLGSGAAPGDTIGVWRRGTDSGWVSRDGAPPVPITATNPIDPNQPLNAEGAAVADGSAFVILEAGVYKHVFKVDPATGQGVNLTGNAQVPGAQNRIVTSRGQAAWPFEDNTNGISQLYFYDGSNLRVIDTNILGNPDLVFGRLVYVKQVAGINQVFLFDSTLPGALPVQVTSDASGTNDFPKTDGFHIAWRHTALGATNADILLYGGLLLTSPNTSLPLNPGAFREHPFQLNRSELLWQDTAGRLQFYDGSTPYPLNLLPSISFGGSSGGGSLCCVPWLADGFVSWTGLSSDGGTDREVFLLTGTPPADAQAPVPPLLVSATTAAGQITLSWDRVIGAASYNLYQAYDPALTAANYSSLAGGKKYANVTGPLTINGLTNRIYFFRVTAVADAVEGPPSKLLAVAFWEPCAATATNYYAIAASGSGGDAFASGGRNVYRSRDSGLTWAPLAGGIANLDVRALAVDGSRVYAATRDVFNVGPAQILRSLDAGSNWTVVVPDGGQLGEQRKALVIDPTNPARLYAADFHLPTMIEPQDSFVICSTNGGTDWFHLPDPTDPLGAEIRGYALAINPLNSSILYVGGSGTPNLVRSADFGAAWMGLLVGPGYVQSLAIDPFNPQKLYAALTSFSQASFGVLNSSDSGASWSAANTGFPAPLPAAYGLLIDPLKGQQIHAGTDAGYFLSLDAGLHWVAENTGLLGVDGRSISGLALTRSRQLLAATGHGIYRLDLSALNLSSPQLTVVRAGNGVRLSWPMASGDFLLQTTFSLSPSAAWTNVPAAIFQTNGQNQATLPPTNPAAFYRLFKP